MAPKTDAPAPDLDAQLTAAQAALAAAETATAAAQSAFDEAGSLETQQALIEAQNAERAAGLHVGRALRLLKAAQGREEAAEFEQKRARRDELRPRLRHDGVMERLQPLVDREVALLKQVADVRLERRLLYTELFRELSEYEALSGTLGESAGLDHRIDNCVSPHVVAEAIELMVAKFGRTAPVAQLLSALRPGRDAYSADLSHQDLYQEDLA